MPQTVPWDLFKYVVSGLLGLIALLILAFGAWVVGELKDLGKRAEDGRVTQAITNTKLDGTNARLDALIAEMRRQPRR